MAAFGLLAFGARQLRRAPGYSPPVKFRVAIISVARVNDPANLPVTEAAARPAAGEETRRLAGAKPGPDLKNQIRQYAACPATPAWSGTYIRAPAI